MEKNGYMCIYMAVPLHYSPETITILLISYIPNTKQKVKKKSNKVPNKYLIKKKSILKEILNLYIVSYYNIDLWG